MAEAQADWPSSIAKVYAFRGQMDEALKWLDRVTISGMRICIG